MRNPLNNNEVLWHRDRVSDQDAMRVPLNRTLSDEERRQARLTVCDGILTADDARMVLEMLGLADA